MERPRVQLSQGTVVGLTLTENLPHPVESFRGVPFCLPPTGERRFRVAEPVRPNPNAIIDAAQYGPAAPGKPLFAGGPKLTYSEDCLTANVFRKPLTRGAPGKLLPVAVYVHGGAFNRGTSSGHNTASMVAWSEAPYVAVSFNYRLGALGFLPSSVTAEEGVLNLGLKDQIVLFEWVRDNIAAFGGDPSNVTLFGLSAGAHSIGHHLMNYQEGQPPLFHRVIIESGAATSRAVRPFNAEVHEAQFRDFLRELGLPESLSDDEVLPYIRSSVSYDDICRAQTAVFDKYNPSLRWAFQPVIDGDIIPRPPLETWRSGEWHKVPIMTGFTHNEGSIYVDKQLSTSSGFSNFFAELVPLDESEISVLNALYPDPLTTADSPYVETRDGVGSQYKRVEAAYANYAYQGPVRQTADFASAASVPVYLYQWALEGSVIDGARHGDNMRYEFCDPKVMEISPTQAELAKALNAYVSGFIVSGDPNSVNPKLPKWEQFHRETPRAMVFGLNNKELVGGQPGPGAEMMDDTWAREESEFWWSKVEKSQQ